MLLSQQFLDTIYDKFLSKLILLLRMGEISEEEGQELSRNFLALEPFTSFSEMKEKLASFTETHKEFAEVFIYALKTEEESKTKDILEKMRGLMRQNKIAEALHVAK